MLPTGELYAMDLGHQQVEEDRQRYRLGVVTRRHLKLGWIHFKCIGAHHDLLDIVSTMRSHSR